MLRALSKSYECYGMDAPGEKLSLLRQLEGHPLNSPEQVFRLHEILCFLRAYPDCPEVLEQVEQMLAVFSERRDLKRHAHALDNTGITGTCIHYRFYWVTARWLASYWPKQLSIDWEELGDSEALHRMLPLLLTYSETPALDSQVLSAQEWLELLKNKRETDAAFLVQRFERIAADEATKQHLYETTDAPLRLQLGPGTPSRSRAKIDTGTPIAYQTSAPSRTRPHLGEEIKRRPQRVSSLSRACGQEHIDLAREAMITRDRDLDAISWASNHDVRLVEWEDGLQFSWIGLQPRYRLLLEGLYVFMALQNGVPVGYVQACGLFGAAEINFNIFAPWRGMEAAHIYARGLATVREMLGVHTYVIDTFQLGDGNPEAIESGAWWFYYKLGYRPEDPDVKRVLRKELQRMKRNPKHRSNHATLEQLAEAELYFHTTEGAEGAPAFSSGKVGLYVARTLAKNYGADREAAQSECESQALDLLNFAAKSLGRWTRYEKQAWARWAPLVCCLPGLKRWSATDKRDLIALIRAKGARRESEYVKRADAHRRLRRAVLKLSDETSRAAPAPPQRSW